MWMTKWIWGFCFLVCSTTSNCSLGKKRPKEREHLDGNSGVVEASPVNIAPISAGLQPQPLGEVFGGQPDLLRRRRCSACRHITLPPSANSNHCDLHAFMASLLPSIPNPPLYLPHSKPQNLTNLTAKQFSHNHFSLLYEDGRIREAEDSLSEMQWRNLQVGPDVYGTLLKGCVYEARTSSPGPPLSGCTRERAIAKKHFWVTLKCKTMGSYLTTSLCPIL
ncbi:hypothetical protein LR48_Vigan01g122000 [Vigna angularis]|uniref:Uncharacterized protein n=1 Tax=Phaseolus angularis TaxID=3914 RepID=A0A0L9TM81_PHAAN|nr:hypothetical protein LR48_Vigan01g122000 [Vigna angularis]